jgi:hypothetical protein
VFFQETAVKSNLNLIAQKVNTETTADGTVAVQLMPPVSFQLNVASIALENDDHLGEVDFPDSVSAPKDN